MSAKKTIALAVVFIALEVLLIFCVDRPISEYLRQVDAQHPAVINFFRSFTDVGKSKWYLWPSGVVLLVYIALRYARLARRIAFIEDGLLFLFLSVSLSGIVTDIFKPLLGRARPIELMRDGIYGFFPLSTDAKWQSMPSGHATTAVALAAVLTLIFPRGRYVWWAAAVLIAVSRVMVNAHYTADILAGAVVGVTVTLAIPHALNHNRMRPLTQWIFPIDRRARSR